MIDWSAAAACDDCSAPAGSACEPGCSTFASDDLPLAVPPVAVLAGSPVSDDPWFDPSAPVWAPPF